MDHVTAIGGSVSGFVDIGGHTFHEQIQYVIGLLGEDKKTKVILINCFGGMQDMLKTAAAVIDQFQKKTVNKPVVVRIRGLSG